MLLLPPMLAVLLWGYDRWQVKRGDHFKSGLEMHFGWLLALCYIGCLTHPLLDWQTSYAIQLFTPFDKRWYHTDALFIADVWIWTGLAYAIWLSRRREKAAEGKWRRPAVAALAALVSYISANAAVSDLAADAPRTGEPYANPDIVIVSPAPVLFWQRDVVWRQNHAISRGKTDSLTPTALGKYSPPIADGMTDPLARKVLLETPSLASFRRWSILPMARIERGRCRIVVHFQDARFGDPGTGRLGTSATVPTGAPSC